MSAETASGPDVPDADGLLAPLARLPELPVSEHDAVYAELHDALLAALGSDPD